MTARPDLGGGWRLVGACGVRGWLWRVSAGTPAVFWARFRAGVIGLVAGVCSEDGWRCG